MIPVFPTSKHSATAWAAGLWVITASAMSVGFNRVLTAVEEAGQKHAVTDVPLYPSYYVRNAIRNASPGAERQFLEAIMVPAFRYADTVADSAALWAWHNQQLLRHPAFADVFAAVAVVPPMAAAAWQGLRIYREVGG